MPFSVQRITVLPRSVVVTAYAPRIRSGGSPSVEILRTASTPVGAATETRSPLARKRNVVIDAAVGMRPVSPLMPRRATTVATSSGRARLRTGAGRRLASTDGRESTATLGTSGFSVHAFGQYGTLAKNASAASGHQVVGDADELGRRPRR